LNLVNYSNDSPILVSAYDPTFITRDVLPKHSLCDNLGIKTPKYEFTLAQHRHAIKSQTQIPLGVTILHTPGHTPDELALYDEAEMMLYVGDSLYENAAIMFPSEGSIISWFVWMQYLVTWAKSKNAQRKASTDESGPKEVLMNCGHQTVLKPALEMLLSTIAFMNEVVEKKEEVKRKWEKNGEQFVAYQKTSGRLSLECPERLVNEARSKRIV